MCSLHSSGPQGTHLSADAHKDSQDPQTSPKDHLSSALDQIYFLLNWLLKPYKHKCQNEFSSVAQEEIAYENLVLEKISLTTKCNKTAWL